MRVVFASCMKFKHVPNQPIWEEVRLLRPDLLLFLGDNIYLDRSYSSEAHRDRLVQELVEKYEAQINEVNFKRLVDDVISRSGKIVGVWDDHDFLGDNSDGQSPVSLRDASREVFLKYFGRTQAAIDPSRLYCRFDDGNATFILLDTRSYRKNVSISHEDAMLGSFQSRWLVDQLKKTQKYTFVCSSTALFDGKGNESWEGSFGASFEWLKRICGGRSRTVFLTGDIHINMIREKHGLVEWVSSGAARKRIVKRTLLSNFGWFDVDEAGVSGHLISRGDPQGLPADQPLSISL